MAIVLGLMVRLKSMMQMKRYAIDLFDEEIIDKLLNKQRLYYRIGQNAGI